MNKFIRILQGYLIFALPFVIGVMGWAAFLGSDTLPAGSSPAAKFLWETLSTVLILWFVALFVFVTMLAASQTVREATLKRLANVRDRDEREEQITGRAARSSYLSTIGLLVFLIFISGFTLNLTKHRPTPESPIESKLSLGLKFSLLDKPEAPAAAAGGDTVFETRDIPLSKTAILLIVLVWQLGSFRLSARRET